MLLKTGATLSQNITSNEKVIVSCTHLFAVARVSEVEDADEFERTGEVANTSRAGLSRDICHEYVTPSEPFIC